MEGHCSMPPRSCSKNSAPKQSNQSEKLTTGSAHCSDKVREKGVAGKQGSGVVLSCHSYVVLFAVQEAIAVSQRRSVVKTLYNDNMVIHSFVYSFLISF